MDSTKKYRPKKGANYSERLNRWNPCGEVDTLSEYDWSLIKETTLGYVILYYSNDSEDRVLLFRKEDIYEVPSKPMAPVNNIGWKVDIHPLWFASETSAAVTAEALSVVLREHKLRDAFVVRHYETPK